MKSLIITSATVLIAFCTFGQKKEFGWLIGTWRMEGKNIVEIWNVSNDKVSLDGMSGTSNAEVSKDGHVMNIQEQFSLVKSGSEFFYVPKVGDQDPVEFHITSYSTTCFVAENPSHDFPKIIRYNFVQKDGEDYIDASIEGDGKVIPYHFKRVR
jgi:hypothetical protein